MIIGIDASRAEAQIKTGVERYCFELVKGMRSSRPKDVKVVLYSRTPLPFDLGPFDDDWKNEVLEWPPRYGWTQIRLSWEMLRRSPDALFVPSHRLPFFAPRRTIVTIHDASFLEAAKIYDPVDACNQRVSLADSCRRAGSIIVPSHFVAGQLAGRRDTRVFVVPHGVAVPKNKSRAPKKYFLAIGRVEKKKNLGVAIDAFGEFIKTHPDYELHFVGKMGNGGKGIVARAKETLPDGKAVFHNSLPDEEMFAFLAKATALLHPCPHEGFGLPAIEAMAMGIPVIAAKCGAVAEAVGDAGLLVDPDDAGQWAEAMNQTTFDIFHQSLAAKGKARAAEFSWKKASEATWQVLLARDNDSH
jgi:glycosyltransferase involved in cell wall biosynthesis